MYGRKFYLLQSLHDMKLEFAEETVKQGAAHVSLTAVKCVYAWISVQTVEKERKTRTHHRLKIQ